MTTTPEEAQPEPEPVTEPEPDDAEPLEDDHDNPPSAAD